jgi:hypothetical protein
VATCIGGSRLFGDLNDPASKASLALQNARNIVRLDYEANSHDTDPNIYYINLPNMERLETSEQFQPLVSQSGALPRPPKYTLSEKGWKHVAVPLLAAGIGASFLVQAVYFTKQLLEGEKEFEE